MAALLRLVCAVVLFLVVRFVFARLFRRGPASGAAADPPPRVIAGRAQRDPRCGTYVAEELAVRAVAGGRQLYFCSPECRDRFLA